MSSNLQQFTTWVSKRSNRESFFSGTFWFVFSTISEPDLAKSFGLQTQQAAHMPLADLSGTVSVSKRTGTILKATFWHLPIAGQNLHIFFSLEKPKQALQPMYKMLARSNGKAHLFPIGSPLVRLCASLSRGRTLEETHVMRGVSYPSRPNEGGADISLRPGTASGFFARLDEERRVLKTVRFRAPAPDASFCEFTVSRVGYITFHKGNLGSLMSHMLEQLVPAMAESVKPFERARGQFVSFRFAEPYFAQRSSYGGVLDALSRLPRTSVALLHTNPYFHATVTNYEDGGEFDIFITGPSDIHVQGRGEASPASFLRLQDGLTTLFRDATVSLERASPEYRLQDLLEGRV
jgi:hypothetical protein